MKGIKTFPSDIKARFDEYGIVYMDRERHHGYSSNSVWEWSGSISESRGSKSWASRNGVEIYSGKLHHHWFSAKCFSIGIKLKFN